MKSILTLLLVISAVLSAKASSYSFETTTTITGKINFTYLKVIDLRYDTSKIGVLKTGPFNSRNELHTAGNFPDELTAFISTVSKRATKAPDTMLLVLYDYYIQDRPNGDEMGVYHFDGDFFVGQNNSYKYLGGVDTLYEARSGWDVTNKVKQLSVDRFCAIVKMMSTKKDFASSDRTFTATEAGSYRQDACNQFASYHTDSLKHGVYYTLEDFLAQTPVDTPIIVKYEYEPGYPSRPYCCYINKKGKAGSIVKNCFAVVTSTGAYTCSAGRFSKLKISNGQLLTPQYFKGMANTAGGAAMAGFMFGAVGYLVATSATSGSQTNKALYEARLDPVTKTFRPMRRML